MFENFTLYNTFAAIGIFATVFYILKLIIFSIVGGDIEVETDFDSFSDTDASFNFLSVQSILAFLMGFGWVGLALYAKYGIGAGFSIALAFCAGLFFMFISAWLMFNIKKLNKVVKIDLNELTGTQGVAYTSFAPNASGQIQIDLNNKLSTLDAINANESEIKAFDKIKVLKIEDNKIYIVKV